MDMKKILQAIDNASTEVSSSEMQRLRNIVEGKGPLNRLTAAESIAVDHYSTHRTTITSPVLNVQESAVPSMIGKYFKAVEEELKESAQRGNLRARQLAERVTSKLNELSTDTLSAYKKAAAADAKKADAEGDFERGNKRFKGINKATIKQFDNDSKKHKEQDVAEDTKKRCMQCGMTNCSCAPGKCKCKPIAGWIPNKGFKKKEQDSVAEDNDPCWDTHKQIGTKKKGGKTVPNCVPKE